MCPSRPELNATPGVVPLAAAILEQLFRRHMAVKHGKEILCSGTVACLIEKCRHETLRTSTHEGVAEANLRHYVEGPSCMAAKTRCRILSNPGRGRCCPGVPGVGTP
eukprot:gnl/TRDRNA2_/TRDRNA2_96594_c0_seq1.p2 gnl/TRDRNA2_/TRDRNA2_96594_c0~~gnl/TRDRNA2_/TRDRNA2_96594_c0_seq1.p2  ORF type:complete len:107 (-),score=3.35 gnl/TRDRNA2_/TRDRNA2_96594_c0_seq1:74-394(-)